MNLLLTMNLRERHAMEDCIEHSYIEFFIRLGFTPFLLSNKADFALYFDRFQIDGVVLTGGIDVSADSEVLHIRDIFENSLLEYCIQNWIPIFGICRGMQLINVYFGGSLSNNIQNHVNIHHPICCINKPLNQIDIPNLSVNSFHNHGIRLHNIAPSLEIAFQGVDDELVEGIFHPQKPILAIQWHPEREKTPNGMVDKLIKNFFGGSKL